jgi:hypothetical protein
LSKSTSGHRLNADRRLSAGRKAAYFVLNALNNARPYASLDPRLSIRDFVCPDLAAHWRELPRGASPSRTLSDLFWQTLPWSSIGDQLGDVRVLDTGCGNGHYGPRLLRWAGGRIASYTGTDLHLHFPWTALATGDARLHFYASRAETFRDSVPAGTNMFISQSAAEHFDEDLVFFEQIRDYVRAAPGPVLQIHLVPSQACLLLYHLHGVRQYTPRTLSRVTRLFPPDARAVIYRLGGYACNRTHFSFITWPTFLYGRDLRKVRPEEYDRQLFEAISGDMSQPQRSPAFYALVICSNWNGPVPSFGSGEPP